LKKLETPNRFDEDLGLEEECQMKLFIMTVQLMLASLYPASGQATDKPSDIESQTVQELLKANRGYDEALVRGDSATLDEIFAEEYIYTTFDGTVRDKTEQLTSIKSGDMQFDFGKSDDVRIRIYQETAVITGRFTAKGTFRGKNIDIRERYTSVWVKQEGRWMLVAEQGNEIKKP
jgi:hypothetical protein